MSQALNGRRWLKSGYQLGLALAVTMTLWAGQVLAATPFTVVALPDTQNYSEFHPDIFAAQTQWITERAKADNIVFVTMLGDVVNHSDSVAEYKNAVVAVDKLDGPKPAGLVPYSVNLGNHDINNGATLFLSHFGPKRYAGYEWFKGAAPDGLSNYQIITVGDVKILHLNIKYYEPNDQVTIKWAQGVLKENAKLPTILVTHDYMGTDTQRSERGKAIWKDLVVDHDQVFLVLSGHSFGENQRLDNNAAGHTVAQVLSDYQEEANGGNGYLRIMTFDPDQGKIKIRSYSPTLNQYRTQPGSQFDLVTTFKPEEIRVKESLAQPTPETQPSAKAAAK